MLWYSFWVVLQQFLCTMVHKIPHWLSSVGLFLGKSRFYYMKTKDGRFWLRSHTWSRLHLLQIWSQSRNRSQAFLSPPVPMHSDSWSQNRSQSQAFFDNWSRNCSRSQGIGLESGSEPESPIFDETPHLPHHAIHRGPALTLVQICEVCTGGVGGVSHPRLCSPN